MNNTEVAVVTEEKPKNVFRVPEQNLEDLRASIAKLVKRAVKLGCEAPTMAVGDFEDVVHKAHGKPTGVVTRYFTVTIDGPVARLNGWSFVATLEGMEGEVLIRCARNGDVPLHYRNHDTVGDCDHCRVSRRRSETFVLRHDSGEHKQVGRQCLQDFLGGDDPKQVAAMAQLLWDACDLAEAAEDDEGGGFGGSGSHERLSMSAYLAHCAMAIRKEGWLSRSSARAI